MKRQVWIVEDDKEMSDAVGLMLQLLDCEVRWFSGPRPAARALLAGERPDLFILDVLMPEVSGMDLLEFLRQRSEGRDIPVVMLSTEAADVLVNQALDMGADAYVTKPVSIDELDEAMKKALRAHEK